jgi:hypothetical protein
MRTNSPCTKVAYGRFLEVSRVSISALSLCASLGCAHLHRSPFSVRSPPSRHAKRSCALLLVRYGRPCLSDPTESVGSISHVPSAYDVAQKMRSPHPATVAPLGPGEAKRDNVSLLPAGRWRHHSICMLCMLCMLCDIRRCVSLAQPHVVDPLHVGTNTPAYLGMPCFAITCLRASAVVAHDIPSDWRFSRSFKHAN